MPRSHPPHCGMSLAARRRKQSHLPLPPSQILQCVTVNLTVLYALLAYSEVKQKHSGNLLVCGAMATSIGMWCYGNHYWYVVLLYSGLSLSFTMSLGADVKWCEGGVGVVSTQDHHLLHCCVVSRLCVVSNPFLLHLSSPSPFLLPPFLCSSSLPPSLPFFLLPSSSLPPSPQGSTTRDSDDGVWHNHWADSCLGQSGQLQLLVCAHHRQRATLGLRQGSGGLEVLVLYTHLLPYPHLLRILLPPSYKLTCHLSLAASQPTILFRRDMRKIILSNAFIVGTHFLAGFILQVVVYGMIIRLIRRMRKSIRGKLFKEQSLTLTKCGHQA